MLFGLPKERKRSLETFIVGFPSLEERTSGTDTVSLGWFFEPDSGLESEEITLLWLKKGNVKEILSSQLYMFPSGNNKFDLTTNLESARKKGCRGAMLKKEMSSISTKVGLVLTKEHTTPLRT